MKAEQFQMIYDNSLIVRINVLQTAMRNQSELARSSRSPCAHFPRQLENQMDRPVYPCASSASRYPHQKQSRGLGSLGA